MDSKLETTNLHLTSTQERMKNIGLMPDDIKRLAACQTALQQFATWFIGTEVHKEILRLIPIIKWEQDIYTKSFLNRIRGESPAFYEKYIATTKDQDMLHEIAIRTNGSLQFGYIINKLMEMEIFNNDPIGIMDAISSMRNMDNDRSNGNRAKIVRMCAYQSKEELFEAIALCEKINNDLGRKILEQILRIIETAGSNMSYSEAMEHLKAIYYIELSIQKSHEGAYVELLLGEHATIYKGDPGKLSRLSSIIKDMVDEVGPASVDKLGRLKGGTIDSIDKNALQIMFGASTTRAPQAEA